MPLIYADRRDNRGGVRVESQLLWSQIRNRHKHQELKVALLFSAGLIPNPPDLEGYAIGDSILQDYTNSKVRLVFKPGGQTQGPAVANKSEDTANYDYYNDGFDYETFDKAGMVSSTRLIRPSRVVMSGCTALRGHRQPAQPLVRTTQCPTGMHSGSNLSGPAKETVKTQILKTQFLQSAYKGYTGYMPYRCRVEKLDNNARNIQYIINSGRQNQIYLGSQIGSSAPDRSLRQHFQTGGDYYLNNQGAANFIAGGGEK